MIYELGTEEALVLFRRGRCAHLGCVVDGDPYVVPIHYVVEGGYVYAHSGEGRKLDGMRAHPRVCLQIEEIDGEYHWRSAHVFGATRRKAVHERAQCGKLLARVSDHASLAEYHHGTVVHRMMKRGAGQHDTVDQGDGDAQ